MNVESFVHILGADFYTGVPDSQLKALCGYLQRRYGSDPMHHIIAANEGNCVGIAAGYHLATGKTPVVYLQNSGEGNIINPLASLANPEVYGIPLILVIGWRGEPGVKDEPQHIFQGKVTKQLLTDMDVDYFVVGQETSEQEISLAMDSFRERLLTGRQAAFLIRKGALRDEEEPPKWRNAYQMSREDAIRCVMKAAGGDSIISTTGKASRELFELRETERSGHGKDFLTVGSMGHASSIALGVALHSPERRIWCIDGDGALLMHMGALGVIGRYAPDNLIHVVVNNEAHESVGGMPTPIKGMDLSGIAKACGYPYVFSADSYTELEQAVKAAKEAGALAFIEVKCAIGSRENLGRPTVPAEENKRRFMAWIANSKIKP